MSFPNVIQGTSSARIHAQNTSNRFHALGQRMEYEDGRKFRYVLNGAAALAVGNVIQGKAIVSADVDYVCAATAAGSTTISITTGSTSAAQFYAGGFAAINKDPGGGYVYKIKSHPIFTSGAGDILTLDPNDPVVIALTTTSEVTPVANPYNGTIIAPITTATQRIVGISTGILTIAYYGWVQTGGVCAVNSAASQIVGNNLVPVLAAAGRVGVSAGDVLENIGVAISVPTTAGEFGLIHVKLD